MKNTVFINSATLDFDNKLDFTPLSKITNFTKYDASSNAEFLERVKDQEIIITKELPVGRDLISQFPPSVKLICEAGTGYNNIDIVAARERNIAVCNIPSYSTEAVAQMAITFILNLSSSLIKQQIMLQQKNFDNFTKFLQVPHFELQNKTLGVIGAGAIGRHTIRLALALGMNVIVYDPVAKPWGEDKVQFVALEDVFKQSDFITLHCPLMESTRHIVNKDSLKLMKPSAFLVNTSRGPLVKETDLIEALERGEIAGAALDVQEVEPPDINSPLFKMENVIMTPHIGWRRFESRQRLVELMAVNIEGFIQGNPINIVNK